MGKRSYTNPLRVNEDGRDTKHDNTNPKRRFFRLRHADNPLAHHAAPDRHNTVQRTHDPERPPQIQPIALEVPSAEVCHHPALEYAEEQARSHAAQDPACEQGREVWDGSENA